MSLEERLLVELAKVRAFGSPRVLIPYGRGVLIGWTNVSEVWTEIGPVGTTFPFRPHYLRPPEVRA